MASKTEVLTLGGLKIDPQIDKSSIFAPKGAPFIFLAGMEKITTIERILREIFTKKHEGRAESAPPFQCAC